MRKTLLCLVAAVLSLPAVALAHVSVRPRESAAAAEERYTVRVPTEGAVRTIHVQLEIPAGVTVLEVLPVEGGTVDTVKAGDRITSITWKKEIPPKQSAEFVFRARNPAAGDIAWKAHQHFADGTAADWVGPAGDKRPASVTKLSMSASAGSAQPGSGEAATVAAWLKGYDAAFNAKDLEKLASFYDPDVTMYEGGGINHGWANYRDRHLGPETEGVREPGVRPHEHQGDDPPRRAGRVCDVRVLPQGEDRGARCRRSGARDAPAAQGYGWPLED